jgi:hypothetical protein
LLSGAAVQVCYVDEAGCPGPLPAATSNIQPVLVTCGLVFGQPVIPDLTKEFIQLKRRFYPRARAAGSHPLDWILLEVKGSELRRLVVDPSRRKRRHATGFLDKIVELLETYDCRIKGRIWVKGIGQPFNGRSVYTSSVQYIHHWFNEWLGHRREEGIVLCDSRDHALNRVVAHSIFTEKFRVAGDKHPRILEMPMFGHSENHAGLQLADLVCSGLLFPMAVDAFCAGAVKSVHVRPGYGVLRARYGQRLEGLQYRVQEVTQVPPRDTGGIMVDDQIGKQSRYVMFREP